MQKVIHILQNNCCIFIGAGIPKALGFPLWSKLAEDLTEFVWQERNSFPRDKLKFGIRKELLRCACNGKPISTITYCRDLLRGVDREQDYQAKIIEYLHDETKYGLARTNPVYIYIRKLLEKAVVLQTNLDRSIEEYCKLDVYMNTQLPTVLTIPCLIYLHGVVTNPASWVMATDEYINFYQKNHTFANFVQNIFRNNDVLFLGYSLSDKEILDQIGKVKGSGRQYVLVLEEIEGNKATNIVLENDLKHYGINVVRYNVEYEGYEAFASFLKGIVTLLAPPVQAASQNQDGSRIDG